jgi:hypothetical protein
MERVLVGFGVMWSSKEDARPESVFQMSLYFALLKFSKSIDTFKRIFIGYDPKLKIGANVKTVKNWKFAFE